jgi:hypothetical protein
MTSRDPVNAALRPSVLPSLRTLERKLEDIRRTCSRINHDDLVELWRRAEQASEADGYPSSSMGPGIRSSGDSTTETAALADDVADEVIAALSEAVAEVSEAHGLMRRVDKRLVFAKAVGESHRGRQASGGDCLCCQDFASGAPQDRLRAGFCNACWVAWSRFRQGRSEELGALRREFILWRRAEQAKGESA